MLTENDKSMVAPIDWGLAIGATTVNSIGVVMAGDGFLGLTENYPPAPLETTLGLLLMAAGTLWAFSRR